ncbi:hypothetical protein ABZY20_32745 [Streptomyces sp. NPDC006624]|uniref:hypothetical protein n=1 Tax=Streptomyces sp. NPDC006624 TaxID=3154892 RepID=UPI0033B5FA52
MSNAADTRSCSSRCSGTPATGAGFGSGEGEGTFGSAAGAVDVRWAGASALLDADPPAAVIPPTAVSLPETVPVVVPADVAPSDVLASADESADVLAFADDSADASAGVFASADDSADVSAVVGASGVVVRAAPSASAVRDLRDRPNAFRNRVRMPMCAQPFA